MLDHLNSIRRLCRHGLAGAALLVATIGQIAAAADAVWLTGPALKKKLDQPVGIGWSGTPLRDALAGLARTHQVAILLDRRIDPNAGIDLQLRDVPLRQALEVIGRTRDGGSCVLESVAYIGPAPAAEKLRTLAAMKKEQLGKLPAPRGLELARVKVWKWDDLAVPADLLQQAAKEAGLQIEGLDKIPHDLWAAADLPPLPITDRLLLVCAQFDLSFDWDARGTSISLTPWPAEIAIERSYPAGRDAEKVAEQIRAALAECKVEVAGDKVLVRGLLEHHEMIEAARTAGAKTVAAASTPLAKIKVEQFKVQNKSVKEVMDSLRQQLGLEIRYDMPQIRKAGKSLETLISLDLKNVSIDDLLRETLTQAGLTFERNDRVVQVRAKE
jgi:hypothetical protein